MSHDEEDPRCAALFSEDQSCRYIWQHSVVLVAVANESIVWTRPSDRLCRGLIIGETAGQGRKVAAWHFVQFSARGQTGGPFCVSTESGLEAEAFNSHYPGICRSPCYFQ